MNACQPVDFPCPNAFANKMTKKTIFPSTPCSLAAFLSVLWEMEALFIYFCVCFFWTVQFPFRSRRPSHSLSHTLSLGDEQPCIRFFIDFLLAFCAVFVALHKHAQLADVVQHRLQVFVGDLAFEGWDQRARFFGCIAAERACGFRMG
jgi:hypothetical protein